MIEFQTMTEILQPQTHGIAEVRHFEVTQEMSDFSRIRAIQHPEEFSHVGCFSQLYVEGQLVMSDTHMEKNSNYDFLLNVKETGGDILVAGLGLGMILVPCFGLSNVRSITVVEKHQDVVDLVFPALQAKFGFPQCPGVEPRRFTVLTADINDWTPPLDCRWDIIYFDIWPNICEDYYKEILRLKERFKRFKRRGGWMKGWMENRYQRNRRGW
jgi:spermidine synthase